MWKYESNYAKLKNSKKDPFHFLQIGHWTWLLLHKMIDRQIWCLIGHGGLKPPIPGSMGNY